MLKRSLIENIREFDERFPDESLGILDDLKLSIILMNKLSLDNLALKGLSHVLRSMEKDPTHLSMCKPQETFSCNLSMMLTLKS